MAVNSCYKRFNELEVGRVKGEVVSALPGTYTSADLGKIFLLKKAGAVDEIHVVVTDAAGAYATKKVTIS